MPGAPGRPAVRRGDGSNRGDKPAGLAVIGQRQGLPGWVSELNGIGAVGRWMRSPVWFLVATPMLIVALYPWGRDLVLDVEVTPAERGYCVALRAGCFSCHGPDGGGGVKNPGSEDGEVPGFGGGTPMMWVKDERELREYVVDGAPRRKRADPRYRQQMEDQLLGMPAYGDYLSVGEIDDLMVYLRAVSGLITPPDELAAQGQELAYRLGCFQCHGPMGAGGTGNPGSLKGYISGWWGDDFRDLVRSDDELRDWILDGAIARLQRHPVARYFTRGQRVKMPAFRRFIDDAQLRALMRYVRWVNDGEWQTQPLNLDH